MTHLDPVDWALIRVSINMNAARLHATATGMDELTAYRSLQGLEMARELARKNRRKWA